MSIGQPSGSATDASATTSRSSVASPRGPVLTRRAMLAGGAAAVLAACTGGGNGGEATSAATSPLPSPGTTMNPQPAGDAVAEALAAAGHGDAELALTPQTTWPELLVGLATDMLLVVTDAAGEIVTDPLEVTLVDTNREVVAGPETTMWYPDDRLPSKGLHAVRMTVADPGTLDVVVASGDGARAGTAGIQALPPQESLAPAPGDTIPAMVTPTSDDPQGLEELCTREENCGLHDVSLDQALAAGPVVLCVATPKFCQTAICGPVLDDVLSVAESGEHGDYTFIHVEPYEDADLTETELVSTLELPTEPWTWVLQTDGTIVERYPGPVLPDLLGQVLSRNASGTDNATSSPTSTSSPTESAS